MDTTQSLHPNPHCPCISCACMRLYACWGHPYWHRFKGGNQRIQWEGRKKTTRFLGRQAAGMRGRGRDGGAETQVMGLVVHHFAVWHN